ncbi:MAG: DHH family phosphoesterase [Clostridia bacterium]|nr:DHH family phosphoesterase [Clostridia bacterium]
MSKKPSSSNKNRIPYASRFEFAIVIALGCLNIILFALLAEFANGVSTVFFAIALLAIYLIEIAIVGIKRANNSTFLPKTDIHDLLMEDGSIVLKNSKSPIVALDVNGTILWYNEAMQPIFNNQEYLVGENIDNIFSPEVRAGLFSGETVTLGDKLYDVEGFTVSEREEGIYLMLLTDVTALTEVMDRYNDERVAVAYIAIDNVEDVLQYVQEKFRDAVAIVEDKLKNWAASVNGVIKAYENEKYIMIFESKYLDDCIADRFSILDSIRETRVGDGVSITVSIGVSRISGSLAEREAAAKDAIDMALQRGGDQVVYKTENSTEYYGGRTKSVYKRSNVRSRTFTTQLTSLMARADNVVVMGHRYGDFDSFGASVGIARLCMLCGVRTNIAIDMRDKNLEPCIRLLQSTEGYQQMFVDNAEGLDLVGPDTLVILVDHNTVARAQFANIANKVDTIAIIDHHRTTEALPPVVKLSYIEPSASSACELVSEMLENAISSQNLLKEVADMLLAGVLLDTKQFTRNTGTRTFGVAQYLRGAGASPQDVYNLFKTAPSELSKEARFHTAISIYRENIAISCCDGETDESYRIIASKAADKMLTLRGIEAAFTLVRIGDQIHISGRSNGKINVQLILERLNGGGHFDVAGAQVVSDSVESVLVSLKESIDKYLEI